MPSLWKCMSALAHVVEVLLIYFLILEVTKCIVFYARSTKEV